MISGEWWWVQRI